jgi:hypothetical protein
MTRDVPALLRRRVPAFSLGSASLEPTRTRGVDSLRRVGHGPVRHCPQGAWGARCASSAGCPVAEEKGMSEEHVQALAGLGQMTQDTCGKKFLPTLHPAFKANIIRAKALKSSKESCCGTMAIRLV